MSRKLQPWPGEGKAETKWKTSRRCAENRLIARSLSALVQQWNTARQNLFNAHVLSNRWDGRWTLHRNRAETIRELRARRPVVAPDRCQNGRAAWAPCGPSGAGGQTDSVGEELLERIDLERELIDNGVAPAPGKQREAPRSLSSPGLPGAREPAHKESPASANAPRGQESFRSASSCSPPRPEASPEGPMRAANPTHALRTLIAALPEDRLRAHTGSRRRLPGANDQAHKRAPRAQANCGAGDLPMIAWSNYCSISGCGGSGF